jgi:hypothetical protein
LKYSEAKKRIKLLKMYGYQKDGKGSERYFQKWSRESYESHKVFSVGYVIGSTAIEFTPDLEYKLIQVENNALKALRRAVITDGGLSVEKEN